MQRAPAQKRAPGRFAQHLATEVDWLGVNAIVADFPRLNPLTAVDTGNGGPATTDLHGLALTTAAPWRRCAASMLDTLLWLSTGLAAFVGVPLISTVVGMTNPWVILGLAWVPVVALLAAHGWMLRREAQTLGMSAMRIRLTSAGGDPITLWRIWLWRQCSWWMIQAVAALFFVPWLVLVGINFGLLFSTHGRTIQDRIARTRVVATY